MIRVFGDVIVPVILVAVVGGAVARRVGVAVAPLSSLTFNLLTPALVFDTLSRVEISGPMLGRVAVVVIANFIVLAVLSAVWSKAAGHDRPTAAATALCSSVANMGNLGLPVVTLAFGQTTLDIAIIAFVISSVLSNSGGVAIASLASGSVRAAIWAPLHVPALWAAAAALLMSLFEAREPVILANATDILAGAAIPAMLVVLGLQLTRKATSYREIHDVSGPVVLRLCVSPLVATTLAVACGLDRAASGTLIVLSGMPTAVSTTILASKYSARPVLVTRVVVTSTLLSMATLTAILTMVR